MKRLIALGFIGVLLAMPIVTAAIEYNRECDGDVLVKTANLTIGDVFDEQITPRHLCEYGCDAIERQCNPTPFNRNIILIVIVLAVLSFGGLFWKYGR